MVSHTPSSRYSGWPGVAPPDADCSSVATRRSSDLTAKAVKDRYASVLHQVALRTLHEVLEADRRGCIDTISLTVATTGIDSATGQVATTPLVAVATDRATFEAIDLANVVPQATLGHLGAVISKNPHGLVAIDTSKGIRGK